MLSVTSMNLFLPVTCTGQHYGVTICTFFFTQTTTAEQLLEFFKQVGDVKFVRMAGDETQPTRFAFVEFVEQESVARALTFNGVMFGDRPLKYVLFVKRSFYSQILHKTL